MYILRDRDTGVESGLDLVGKCFFFKMRRLSSSPFVYARCVYICMNEHYPLSYRLLTFAIVFLARIVQKQLRVILILPISAAFMQWH